MYDLNVSSEWLITPHVLIKSMKFHGILKKVHTKHIFMANQKQIHTVTASTLCILTDIFMHLKELNQDRGFPANMTR